MGRLVAEGDMEGLKILRGCASDPRWRLREAVAMALQKLGKVDMEALLAEMRDWSLGIPLEQRAAAAALCEPNLLLDEGHAEAVLNLLDSITRSIAKVANRKSEDFKALRKGLGYCWSVAVAALPSAGKELMEKWLLSDDRDIQWIMKQNLKKKRLARVDEAWVQRWSNALWAE
jgi:hypothetical protein